MPAFIYFGHAELEEFNCENLFSFGNTPQEAENGLKRAYRRSKRNCGPTCQMEGFCVTMAHVKATISKVPIPTGTVMMELGEVVTDYKEKYHRLLP